MGVIDGPPHLAQEPRKGQGRRISGQLWPVKKAALAVAVAVVGVVAVAFAGAGADGARGGLEAALWSLGTMALAAAMAGLLVRSGERARQASYAQTAEEREQELRRSEEQDRPLV